jgi:GT2 family glycosyltransferase
VELLIGDTGSIEPQVWRFYDEVQTKHKNIKVINFFQYFFSNNYNRLINEYAHGEYLILLNNDTIVTPGWIDKLIEPLANGSIGIVGCKLLYVDNTIQHAGIEFNEEGFGIHVHKGKALDFPEANYKALVPAVTFACVAIRHDIFGRFQLSEDFREECQDTDFCLRIQQAGFEVLYNPEVEIYHLECSSRNWRTGDKDRRLFRKRWGNTIRGQVTQGYQRTKYDEENYRNSITIVRDDGIGDLLMGISAFKSLGKISREEADFGNLPEKY